MPQCSDPQVRGCDWVKNYTVSGRPCAYWNDPNPVHPPNKFINEWVFNNDISHNRCSNPDQEFLGPWCYTTDPTQRWNYCGICDVKFENHVEYPLGNDSWIDAVKDIFLDIHPEKTDSVPELLADLQVFEDARIDQKSKNFNFNNDEMTRRIIELTTPGGIVYNSNLEEFSSEVTIVDDELRAMNDTNVSMFLKMNGWHFKEQNFPFASINGKTIQYLKDYHEEELTKYGKCHVFKDLPEQYTKHGLILWINANHDHYYTSEVKIDERSVEGVTAGVRVFFEDAQSEYIDDRYGTNTK